MRRAALAATCRPRRDAGHQCWFDDYPSRLAFRWAGRRAFADRRQPHRRPVNNAGAVRIRRPPHRISLKTPDHSAGTAGGGRPAGAYAANLNPTAPRG